MSMSLYYNVLIPCFSFFLCISTVNSVYFNISSFGQDNKNVSIAGISYYSMGNVELTNPNSTDYAGWATLTEPVHLWHSEDLSDFTTHFIFSINGQELYHGEGIAFFLAPANFLIPPNGLAKHLGLFNETTYDSPSLNQIIAVEFDTHHNNENWDVQHDHVGIDHNSLISAVNTSWNFTLGKTYHAWITYNSTTKNLSVYWTYENNTFFRGESLLSYQIDLREVLPQDVMVGFSASSGFTGGRHTLLSWEFNSTLAAKKEINIKLVVGLAVPGALILICGIAVALIMLKKPKDDMANLRSLNERVFEKGAGPKSFSYKI